MKRGQMSVPVGRTCVDGRGGSLRVGGEFAHPDHQSSRWSATGPCSNNMAELITIAKYKDRWADKRLVVCVFYEDLNEVTWEQRVMNGNPRFDASQDIPDVRYSQFAELVGLKGLFVDNPDDLGAAWDEALSAEGTSRP